MNKKHYLIAVCAAFVGCGEPQQSTVPLTADQLPPPTAKAAPADASAQTAPGKEDDDAPTEFTTTTSGLKYRVTRKGEGKKPVSTDTVLVHYRGTLDDGTVFDSSYDRGEPISFPLNGVIKGWTEGMQLVGEGGMIELQIPPELGYGATGAGASVPPNAQLHFTVELLSIQ